jgi:hypothetical protein
MKLSLEDDFQQLESKWSQQSTQDNFFIGSSEGFEVWRKNNRSGFFIFPEKVQEYRIFDASITFEFDGKGKPENSAGLVLQAQPDGSGAVVVEINRKKQFRIRRAAGNRMVQINEPNGGWKKSPKKIKGDAITLSVKTSDKVYDVYINGVYIHSFTEIEYSKGRLGLYIGPESKVVYKKMLVKIDDEATSVPSLRASSPDDKKSLGSTVSKLKLAIQQKDQQIVELENKLKDQSLFAYHADSVLLKQSQEAVARVDELELELERLNADKFKLEGELLKLQQYKNAAAGSDGGNIAENLVNINESLKQELIKARKTVEELEASLLKQQSQDADWIKKLNQQENAIEQYKITEQLQRRRLIEKDSIITQARQKQQGLEKALKDCMKTSSDKPSGAKPKKDPKKEESLFDEK